MTEPLDGTQGFDSTLAVQVQRGERRDERGDLITPCPTCGADSYIVDADATVEGDPRACDNGHQFRSRDGWPERAGREDESQPLPVGTDEVDTQTVAIRLIEQRRALGIKRYGQPLQPSNGRDSLWDAVEEAFDLCLYLLNEWRHQHPGEMPPGFGQEADIG
jgi:hypothetical protein